MYISNYHDCSRVLRINFETVKRIMLKIQKRIYKAAQACQANDIFKHQNSFFLKKEILLVLVKKAIIFLKKNYI